MLAAAATPTAPAAIAAAADVNMVGSGQQMDGWDEEEEEIEDDGEEAGGRGYGSGRTSKSRQSSAVPPNVLSSSLTSRVPLHPSSSTTTVYGQAASSHSTFTLDTLPFARLILSVGTTAASSTTASVHPLPTSLA